LPPQLFWKDTTLCEPLWADNKMQRYTAAFYDIISDFLHSVSLCCLSRYKNALFIIGFLLRRTHFGHFTQ